MIYKYNSESEMDSIYSKIALWFTLILGLSMLSYGFVAGPISVLSLLDVISGNKAFNELHKQRPIPVAFTSLSSVVLDDDNVYADKNYFNSELDILLMHYLVDSTQEEVDILSHTLPKIHIKRQMYLDFKTRNEKPDAMSVYTSEGMTFPGFLFNSAERTLVASLLMGKEKVQIEAFLKANNLLTKSSGSRVQSTRVMFEFSTTQKLSRIYSR